MKKKKHTKFSLYICSVPLLFGGSYSEGLQHHSVGVKIPSYHSVFVCYNVVYRSNTLSSSFKGVNRLYNKFKPLTYKQVAV